MSSPGTIWNFADRSVSQKEANRRAVSLIGDRPPSCRAIVGVDNYNALEGSSWRKGDWDER